MSSGIVTQIIGAVIDVEFDKDNIPKVYEALMVDESGTTLEVQQQLGDGVVRTIAMGATEGLKEAYLHQELTHLFLYLLVQKLLEELLMFLETPLMKKGQLVKNRKCLFIENLLLILINPHQAKFWKLV